MLSSALKDGYGSHIMQGFYPAATIFINLPASEIDVNVHPAKHEIRFRKESLISNLLAEAIRDALNSSIQPVESVSISKLPLKSVIDSSQVNYIHKEQLQEQCFRVVNPSEEKSELESPDVRNHIEKDRKFPEIVSESGGQLSLPGCGFLKILDIMNKTYILALSDIGLVVIDQHAAHERIIYERLLKDYSKSGIRQDLLIPITIELSKPELQLLRRVLPYFDKIGFGIDFFGDNTVLVHSVPNSIRSDNISGLISNVLNSIIEKSASGAKPDESLVARAACSLAVKANDTLSIMEAAKLVSDLSKCDLPFNCPHGRPTVINISIKELEKRFGRTL